MSKFKCTRCGEPMPSNPTDADLLRDECPNCGELDPEVTEVESEAEEGEVR